MSRKYDVMVAGHLCLDIIPHFTDIGATKIEELMRPGKLVNAGEAIISTGGAVSNAGVNMKKLGNNVCFCACVGDDRFGKLTIEILRQNGSADGIRVLDEIERRCPISDNINNPTSLNVKLVSNT